MTVVARTMEELRRARNEATDADLVELRLDSVDRPDVRGALEGRRQPVIVTCRARWEGGRFEGSEDERERILTEAVVDGAEFVDVEAAAAFAPSLLRLRAGRGVVLSRHVFGTPPADVAGLAQEMRATGAEVIKLAIEARQLRDVLPLFEAGEILSRTGREGWGHVLLAMGAAGVVTRVLAARMGNRWTYAGDGVAPGQVPAQQLVGELQFRRIKQDSAVYGVVGNPVSHSLSPTMHNAGFAALGLRATYLPLEAQDAEDFVVFARSIGLRGASITAPFKVALVPHADDIDPVAQEVGAINTLTVRNGRWIGANTDVEGFTTPLAGRIGLKGTRVTVLGAGGAARAVATALGRQGALVTICARRRGAAADVAARTRAHVGTWPPRPGSWDVLVNATSAGGHAVPVNPIEGTALDGEIVFDLVYDPADTALIRQARAAGCLTIGGIEMLVAQAERQFEMWTGQRPPAGLFQAAAATAVRRRRTALDAGDNGEADNV